MIGRQSIAKKDDIVSSILMPPNSQHQPRAGKAAHLRMQI